MCTSNLIPWVYALAGGLPGIAKCSSLRGKLPPLPAHLRSVLAPPSASSGWIASADALPCAKLGTSGAPAACPAESAGLDGLYAAKKTGIAHALPARAAAEGLHAALQQQAALLRPAAAAPKRQAWPLHTNDVGCCMHVSGRSGMARMHASGKHVGVRGGPHILSLMLARLLCTPVYSC